MAKLSHSKAGLEKLFQSDLLRALKEVMATSDIIRYRIYEVQLDLLLGCKCKCLE